MADNALLGRARGISWMQNSLLDGAPMYNGGQQATPTNGYFVPRQAGIRGAMAGLLDPQTPDDRMSANVVGGFAEGPATMRVAVRNVRGISPSTLIFREAEQNRIAEVAKMFPPGEGYYPIVVATTAKGRLILDGHNRTAIARQRGDLIDAVEIPGSVYRSLLKSGLDEMSISNAALERAGQSDAAGSLRQQFNGSRLQDSEHIAESAFNAFEKLHK